MKRGQSISVFSGRAGSVSEQNKSFSSGRGSHGWNIGAVTKRRGKLVQAFLPVLKDCSLSCKTNTIHYVHQEKKE